MRHNQIYPGTSLTKNANFVDADGFAVDPDAVSFQVCSPCGTISSYDYAGGSITRTAVGAYSATFTPDDGGIWSWRWAISSGTPRLATEGTETVTCSPFIGSSYTDVYRY